MKKRAFTLTELLVVVVIIGVLSAVVLPKFIKIIETRKTTEAENIMAAVRNEQEARCMLGKNYTASTTELASLPKRTSGNYEYTLQLQGITATSKGGSYQLKIQSYADGGICCSDVETGGCEKLNKNYPICSASTPSTSVCAVPGPGAVCEVPGETTQTDTQRCGCTNSGTKEGTRTFDSVACEWGDWTWGSCSEQETNCPSCTEGETRESGEPHCGKQAREICHGNTWESYSDADVSFTAEELANCDLCDTAEPVEQDCEQGDGKQTRTKTCNTSTGRFEYSDWDVSACTTESTTCDAANTRWYDEEMDAQAVELVDACYAKGMDINLDRQISGKLENLTKEQMIAACCECCPSGTAFTNTGTEVCSRCSDLGKNYFYDASNGSCGGCSQRFKPRDTDVLVSTLGVYANYERQESSRCRVEEGYTGTSLSYSKKPCSTCDANAETCEETGYSSQADSVMMEIRREYPARQLSTYSSGDSEWVYADLPAGYRPAAYAVAPNGSNVAANGAAQLGFNSCSNWGDEIPGVTQVNLNHCNSYGCISFYGSAKAVYRQSTGYTCVRQ